MLKNAKLVVKQIILAIMAKRSSPCEVELLKPESANVI